MMHVFLLFACVSFGCSSLLLGVVLLVRLRTCEASMRRLDPKAVAQRHPTDILAQGSAQRPLKLIILHPDLGIGGAERLIVDAAIALQRHQHITPVSVIIVTNHCDPKRAFAETISGAVTVQVIGSWIPTTLYGRAKVLCVTLQMMWAAFMVCYRHPDTDCFMVDQIANVLPLLHFLAPHIPRLFYCHFPDQCCDSNRDADGHYIVPVSRIHRWYRLFFDFLESRAMSYADNILSNSKFSMGVTVKMFPHLQSVIDPEEDIFYPPVSCVDKVLPLDTPHSMDTHEMEDLRRRTQGRTVVLSINRYERKKNIALAIEAFAHLVSKSANLVSNALLLVIAGGYDERVAENVEHLAELKEIAARHFPTEEHVLFLQNISDAVKGNLLSQCCCLVYTPEMEHFGIVPIEAMMYAKPVVAVNRGGPCETIGEGGTLCDSTPEAFAAAITTYLTDEALSKRTGAAGRERVKRLFHIDLFAKKLATRLVTLWTKKNAILSNEAKITFGGKTE